MKQIAVILGAINLDNQRKLLEGMTSVAKQKDCNLFVFTNYIGNHETLESITLGSRIFDLPDFHQFDGVILAGNSIFHPIVLNRLQERILQANVPTVSIDRHYEGMSTIEISSYDAQFEMVEHFICEHNCKNIFYVSGPTSLNNKEACIRLQAYRDALEKHGLPYLEENVYEGFFTLEGGINAAKRILASFHMPDAIICGNDDMALGVMETVQNAGYLVPKDIKISGFDNTQLSMISNPALSTVDQNQYTVGSNAVYEILELLDNKPPSTKKAACILECRESCGCNIRTSLTSIGEKYVELQHDVLRMTDVLKSMEADFSKSHSVKELTDALQTHVPLIGLDNFYLCLCEEEKVFALPEQNLGQDIDILKVNNTFTSSISLPFAYKNGEFTTYPNFDKGLVLPDICRKESVGNVYIINQIYYQNCCYGYAICGNTLALATSNLYNLWLMEIGIGLENTRKWMLLKDAIDKLNGMWCYDNLTTLYNRSGFYYKAQPMLENLKAENSDAFILFIDADGLKLVNDNIGHEAGDTLIQSIGEIVRQHTTTSMLSMRYGGDEFVIFGGYNPARPNTANELIDAIQSTISKINAERRLPFRISISIGQSSWKAAEIEDLSKLIDQADQKMYAEKKAKKMR